MRVVALVVAGFLFLSTLESWAGFWILGRWYVSSRYASVSLQTVRNWLDRGIINRSTEWAKVFVRKHGKWILLTIGLSEVIREIDRIQTASQVCYRTVRDEAFDWVRCYVGGSDRYFCYGTRTTQNYFTMSPEGDGCIGYERRIPGYSVYRWNGQLNQWEILADRIPTEGRHFMGRTSDGRYCFLNVSVNIPPCPFTATTNAVRGYPPSQADLSQRRRIPVRVFPNPSDFLRDDVIANDPALRWLRDEFERLSRDASIPTIPADALGDLELPSVDWSISPDEALDHVAESSRDLPREGSREGERSREGDVDLSFPGLNTDLEVPVKRPFPVELINQLVQNHPLLRILQSVSLDASGGGSCVFGQEPFVIDMCRWAWVLNVMGSFLVPLAFLYGLFGFGRND